MRFYKNLYLGESISEFPVYLKYKLKYSRKFTGWYCVTLPESGGDLLEIYKSELLKHPVMKASNPFVVGIAGTKKEAMKLVEGIINEVHTRTGGLDVRGYLTHING